MRLDKRIKQLEETANPEQLPRIETVIYDCQKQVSHPELFDKVLISNKDRIIYELKPKDPDFKCDCHCCTKQL